MQQTISDLLSLLTNKTYLKLKSKNHLDNLTGYTSFKNAQEYQELLFPLFENEHYSSIRREAERYEELLKQQEQFPLVYQVAINQDYGFTKEEGLMLNIISEIDTMPFGYQYDDRYTWKYNKYTQYLIFRETNKYFVSLYIYDKARQKYLQTLAIYQRNFQKIRSLILPKTETTHDIIQIFRSNYYFCDSEYQTFSTKQKQRLFIFVQPLASTSTFINEAQSIYNLQSCHFLNLILKPSPVTNTIQQSEFSVKVKQHQEKYFQNETFTKHFNENQLQAIAQSLDFTRKITIIKGPPGTGKTQTTLGIVSIMTELLNLKDETEKSGAILILAKSNSVVNDLVRKIVENKIQPQRIIFCQQNKPNNLNVVRLGRGDMCDQDILRYSLEIRTQDHFFSKKNIHKIPLWQELYDKNINQKIRHLMNQQSIINLINYFQENEEEQVETTNKNTYFSLFALLQYIDIEVNRNTKDRRILDSFGNYYVELREQFNNQKKEVDKIEKQFLHQCNVIVSTLNSCSHECLKEYFNNIHLRMCIVDEAPTALEPSMLIPFVQFQTLEKIVLLGDIKQLNPIVISKDSKNYGYNRSMFERLAKVLKQQSNKLIIQYRQMPNLAEITSLMFYKSTLKNGNNQMQLLDSIKLKVSENRNRLFFNTPFGTEQDCETSKRNILESQAIMSLVKYLLQNNPQLKQKQITIISAYAQQKILLEQELKQYHFENVELDTVDSFQGKENDIIIISLVRSNHKRGFLNDKKRTNVALSRAKYCQFIFGSVHTLKSGFSNWGKIIELLKKNHEIVNYTEKDVQNQHFFEKILKNEEL